MQNKKLKKLYEETLDLYYKEALEDILDCWDIFTSAKQFSDHYEDLLDVGVEVANLRDRKTNKAFAVTKLEKDWSGDTQVNVYFDPIILGLSDQELAETIVHEIAHCCVYFDHGTLSPGGEAHGKDWKKYTSKFSKLFDVRDRYEQAS